MTATTQTYTATIDGGEGGETTIQATDLAAAAIAAAEWAAEGEWREDGCVIVRVTGPDGTERIDVPVIAADAADAAVETTVCGCQIQIDRSGQGHCWRNIDAEDIPADIREEIAAEILDGGKDECEDYVATNGQHYRW